MAEYSFTVPILPGKTETWKNNIREMMGPRHTELNKSRQRIGLTLEQAWLQHTPNGDMVVVHWDTTSDDPMKVFDHMMKSDDPFDKWFREKVLIECHGMKPGDFPPKNELLLNNKTQQIMEKEYTEARKK